MGADKQQIIEEFQLTAARRRLVVKRGSKSAQIKFQLTAARRRLVMPTLPTNSGNVFQLTAARRRLAFALFLSSNGQSFNSQPPEGGWRPSLLYL